MQGRSGLVEGLFEHQGRTVARHNKSPILFDMSDPGTGKTRVPIVVYLQHVHPGKLVVFSTKTTMHNVWENEILDVAPHLQVQLLTPQARKRGMDMSKDVFVINHDGAKWLRDLVTTDKRMKGLLAESMLVNDESTYFKHHTSQRSKAVARVAPLFGRRTNLSGAPMTLSVLDLWHQYYLLDQGKRLGWSFSKFRNSVCTPVPVTRDIVRWVDKPAAYSVVMGLVQDITIRHVLEDCLDIPPNKMRPVHFELNLKHRRIYEDMKRQALLYFEQSGRVVNAVNAGAMVQKLLQIASGAVYADEENYELIDSDRYELVADLAEERAHSIVFFLWKHQRIELIKALKARGLSYALIDGSVRSDTARNEAVRAFQAGELRVLLAHPKSAGHGLTLTRASATIWASPTYDYEFYDQGFRRIYRATQTQPTETIIVAAPKTADMRAFDVLLNKGKRQNDFLWLVSG